MGVVCTKFNTFNMASMLSTDARQSESVKRNDSESDGNLPSLKSLYKISLMEQRLQGVVPHISKASYSLKNGKGLMKMKVSVVMTGSILELSMKSLKNMRSTFSTMVEWYLQGKSSAVMLTTSSDQSSDIIRLLLRLRGLGWKRWKCMLTLDLSSKKFVVPGIDPESSPNFLQSLVKERVHLSSFSFFDRRYYAAVSRHMASGNRAMTPDEVHCLKSSRLAFHVLRSSKHDTLSLPALQSDVDMCDLSTNLLFFFICCKEKNTAPVHIRRERMFSSQQLKTLTRSFSLENKKQAEE